MRFVVLHRDYNKGLGFGSFGSKVTGLKVLRFKAFELCGL